MSTIAIASVFIYASFDFATNIVGEVEHILAPRDDAGYAFPFSWDKIPPSNVRSRTRAVNTEVMAAGDIAPSDLWEPPAG